MKRLAVTLAAASLALVACGGGGAAPSDPEVLPCWDGGSLTIDHQAQTFTEVSGSNGDSITWTFEDGTLSEPGGTELGGLSFSDWAAFARETCETE